MNTITLISIFTILLLNFARGFENAQASVTTRPQYSQHTIRQAKSEQILRYMNKSADPCENFYEFVCGNYAKHNPISRVRPALNSMEILRTETMRKIKVILTRDSLADTHADKQVKNFYRSCIRSTELKIFYRHKLLDIIKDYGQMPLIEGDQWQENNFAWIETVAEIVYKTGLSNIFSIVVSRDLNGNSNDRVYLGQSLLPLKHKSFYFDKSFVKHLNVHGLSIADILNTYLGVERERALKTAKELMDFEIALAHGLMDSKSYLNTTEEYTLVSLHQLQRRYLHFVDLKRLIGKAIGFIPQEVLVQVQYVDSALDVLQRTPKRVVANYVFYTLLVNFIPYATGDKKVLEEKCLSLTQDRFNENLLNMLYRKTFNPQTEEGIFRMWREMKKIFAHMLQSPGLYWMQEDTRKRALQKLKAMKLKINSHKKNNFAEEFAQLNLNDYDYVDNVKSILTMRGLQARAKFKESPQPPMNYGVMSLLTPLYLAAENLLLIPVAALQPHYLWSNSHPNTYNFASLGFYMAHEMIRGFESHFDERDLWDAYSAREFHDRTKCFADQYRNYSYDKKSWPKIKLQTENIADNGGIRLAYTAYLQWHRRALSDQHPSKLIALPGITYTQNQMFFIHYGQQWCANYSPLAKAQQAASGGSHVPEQFRVLGPLSNFDAFSTEFNCPSGAAMNPRQKCRIF